MDDTTLTSHPSYIQWRRDLQEHHLLIEPERGHACWDPQANRTAVDPIVGLHGCLDCGCSHWCIPPFKYCPRVVSVEAGSATCAFSGHVLDNAPIMMLGTYKQECAARETGRKGNNNGSGKIRFAGRKRQKALRRRANRSAYGRKRWNDQADILQEMDLALMEADIYERAFGAEERPSKRARIDKGEKSVEEEYNNIDDNDDNDGGENAESGFDTEGLMYRAGFTAVARPQAAEEETRRDCDYMRQYIQPVANLATQYAAVFHLVGPLPPPPPPTAAPPAAATTVETPHSLPWPLLQLDVEELLPHQKTICRLITAFLDYFTPFMTSSVGPPLTAQQYTVWTDRVIVVFNHVSDVRDQYDVANTSTLQRLIITMLTSLFTITISIQDRVGMSHYLWLPDPWLKQCEQRGLFTQEHLQKIFSVMRSSGRHKTSQWANRLTAVLKSTPMSVHTLQAIFSIPAASASALQR